MSSAIALGDCSPDAAVLVYDVADGSRTNGGFRMKLKNKIVLVTGGGAGIGQAIALRFAAEGARVIVNDVTLKAAQQTTGRLAKHQAVAIAADVADSGQVKRMFAKIKKDFGKLDVLVNNAGIAQTGAGEIEKFNRMGEARIAELTSGQGIQTHWTITRDLPDEAWKRMIDVHLNGTFYCTREAIKLMESRGDGVIINMSSIAGLSGLEAVPHYCAAKAALLGFTRALALELGSQRIRVNAICPGFIETPMTNPISPVIKAQLIAQTPLARWGKPEEIAAAALFLASDESSFVTGQWVSPNGGLVMQ
jgi:3-oxoacyl-[acyl-carrier protein] reductase